MNNFMHGINANALGFLPSNNGDDNTVIFQEAVKNGGTIFVSEPGVYDISGTIVLCSNTTLIFGTGVILRRVANAQGEHVGAQFFINEGAYSRIYDENIQIYGLNISCNGFESIKNAKIMGLRGQVAFFYIKKLVIKDFTCMDLCKISFCIHVCTFDDVVIENVYIEGKKDAVHFGKGKNFVVRHGMFRTFDDPIALNAHDYTTSNPQVGWIENGLIEDCYDLADDDTVGYFCRILAGSWVDWFAGMEVSQSDTVVYEGRLYRVSMPIDGKSYVSSTAPSHEHGMAIYDGINWVMVQDDDVIYNCGCKNIRFQNIHLQKERDIAFSVHFDNGKFSHSVYPKSILPVQENIVLDGIYMENKVPKLISTVTPIDSIKVLNSDLKETSMCFRENACEPCTTETLVTLIGNTYKNCSEPFIQATEGRAVKTVSAGCTKI